MIKFAQWYRGLPLQERLTRLEKIRTTNPDLADRRLQRWRSQKPLVNEHCYAQKLSQEGLTENEFLKILGESDDSLAQRCTDPDWLETLIKDFEVEEISKVKIAPVETLTDERLSIGFLHLVKPLLDQALIRLEIGIEKLGNNILFGTENIKGILSAKVPEQLLAILSQTMVLELNVARLEERLLGKTPRERLISFLHNLENKDDALEILQEYPVLARQVIIYLKQWVDISLEFLQRLYQDWDVICEHFNHHSSPGTLVKIQTGAGDTHRKGRSVFILEFSSGLKLVYKPRSLGIDEHLQELLLWLNQQELELPLPLLKILNRGEYGWVEFVEAKGCSCAAEVERFYQRMGSYLALMSALEATDFHLENIIANGENPILIDLETLFRPECLDPNSPESRLIANRKMGQSVMGVGLLPQRIADRDHSGGFDSSGLGAVGSQVLPTRTPELAGKGTDKMQVERKFATLSGSKNVPYLQGKEPEVWTHKENIEKGFIETYRLLLKHRDLFLNLWLPKFANDEIRVVLRDTRLYGLLLQESFHPDALRNALDRDHLFDRLWIDVPNHPSLKHVIRLEKKALWQGDIPFFYTQINCRDICGEEEKLSDFFDTSGLDRVKQRFKRLSENDLEEQLWFIRTSLSSLAMSVETKQTKAIDKEQEFEKIENWKQLQDRLLETAEKIASRLESLAIRDKNQASWIGLNSAGERHWTVKPLAWDLFGGLPGIALFFAYLGEITQKQKYTKLAKDTLETILIQIDFDQDLIASVGGFDGWGGIIHTITHLGTLWQQPELDNRALEWLKKLPPLIAKDEQLDIVAGSSGCILALINLYDWVQDENIKTVAIQCGDRLLEKAISMKEGIGWSTIPSQRPLSGFSHGAAGISLALLKLAAFTGDQRYQEIALEGWKYERSLFSATKKNWHNSEKDQENLAVTWSYGATGIGLARLSSLSQLKTAQINSEINIAMETTMALGFGNNHSICSGDLGSLELLLQGINTLSHKELTNTYYQKISQVLNSIERQGYDCGVPLGVETLGLMTGLAGMGYELIRLAFCDRIPSVLLLESPVNIKI
ncbi:Lanthionine synthetase C family protein [[Leptolyngbya] sp. PCC 7376]|nr:Lanthionine synthetase C family protein [[Leptolyngbya] sp. PCC 7376]